MSHLSRADAAKLIDLIGACRKTARREERAVTTPDVTVWDAALAADDEAYRAVEAFVRSLESAEPPYRVVVADDGTALYAIPAPDHSGALGVANYFTRNNIHACVEWRVGNEWTREHAS